MANKEKLLTSAQKFLSKGQLPKAIDEYRKLVDAFPKDMRNKQKLAELFSREKRNEEALVEYEAVARHFTETGFYLKAIAVFKQMQKIDPTQVKIYYRLAELNEKQGLIGNALTEYRNLAAFYDKKNMHAEVIEVLEKMLTLDPDNLNFSAKVAECYAVSGRTEEAYEKFQSIIDVLDAKGEYTKIIKLYERFLDICPEDGISHLPLARALLNNGSSDKAIQVLKNLLKHSPEDPEIIKFLTDAYVLNKDFANARLTLKHLLKQKEGDLDLREFYVRICLNAGEVTRARDRLEEWKETFLLAGRGSVLQGLYEELKVLLAGDPIVAETLSALYDAAGDQQNGKDDLPAKASIETENVPAYASSDEPTLDSATPYVVDEEDALAVDASSFDVEDQPPVKSDTAWFGPDLALDLDLDLDLEIPMDQVESADSPVEEIAGSIHEEETAVPAEAVEDDEIEIEIDLGELDDFELDFEEELVADDEVFVEEILDDAYNREVDEESAGEVEDKLCSEVGATSEELAIESEIHAVSEGSEVIPEAVDGGEFIADESESREDLLLDDFSAFVEEVEEEDRGLEEFEELEPLERIEDLDELDEIEELEMLAEIEDLDVIEDSEAPVVEAPSGRAAFSAALNVEAELEEAEFYLQQGLYDDAERVVQTLMEYRPGLPVLYEKMDQIMRGRQAAEAESDSTVFADLMADLRDDELLDATDFLDSFDGLVHEDDVEQKLVSEIDSSDTESHYNLGIAYKEMGLYDDAIAEFDKASKDSTRTLDCITLTGQCHMEAGQTDAAMAVFRSGLAHQGLGDEERMLLNFEMGMLHQVNGQLLEAFEFFQLVSEQDSFYRDVSDIIKNLRKELGLIDGSDDDDGPQGNRDRVSYV